jgi:hypothetical protein
MYAEGNNAENIVKYFRENEMLDIIASCIKYIKTYSKSLN